MARCLIATVLVVAVSLAGCNGRIGDYVAASSIAKNGFSREGKGMGNANGLQTRVWGFLDHRNLYGDAGAKRILGDWWGGEGPSATAWRFDLLAEADDEVGQGFQVLVPNDSGRDQLLRAFLADAEAGRSTRVFVTGKLYAFPAPTNAMTLTGLHLEPRSSHDVRLKPRG